MPGDARQLSEVISGFLKLTTHTRQLGLENRMQFVNRAVFDRMLLSFGVSKYL